MIRSLKRKAILSIVVAIALIIAGCVGFYLGWCQIKAPILLVLAFHGVTDTPTLPWEIRYDELKSILTSLKKHEFNSLTPAMFAEKLKSGDFSGRNFLVTFDDGLQSSAEAIIRLKEEMNISSVFFILNDFLNKENYVSNETLINLKDKHNCKIGLHGKRHYEVSKIIAEGGDLLQELEQAKAHLSGIIGEAVTWYAYPYGDYNASATAVLASTSLEIAFTIDGHEIDPGANVKLLPRVMFLRGAAAAEAPDPLDWAPPKLARSGSLTITLACLVIFISLSWIIRARNLLLAIKHQQKSEKAE